MPATCKALGSVPGECDRHCDESQGYHCGPYERQTLFYDTEEPGRAALGDLEPFTVLPYTTWRPEAFYIQGETGYGPGGAAWDATGQRLFVIERGLGGDMNAAVVHVWSPWSLAWRWEIEAGRSRA